MERIGFTIAGRLAQAGGLLGGGFTLVNDVHPMPGIPLCLGIGYGLPQPGHQPLTPAGAP